MLTKDQFGIIQILQTSIPQTSFLVGPFWLFLTARQLQRTRNWLIPPLCNGTTNLSLTSMFYLHINTFWSGILRSSDASKLCWNWNWRGCLIPWCHSKSSRGCWRLQGLRGYGSRGSRICWCSNNPWWGYISAARRPKFWFRWWARIPIIGNLPFSWHFAYKRHRLFLCCLGFRCFPFQSYKEKKWLILYILLSFAIYILLVS